MPWIPEKFKPCPRCGKVEEILGENDSMKVRCDCVESPEFFFVPHVYGYWNTHCEKIIT